MSDELPGPPPALSPTSTVVTKETSTVTTADPSKLPSEDSQVFGVSVRAWITTLIVATVCAHQLMGKEVFEPLYGGFLLSIGFYFGHATKSQK